MNVFVIIENSQFDTDLVSHSKGAFASKEEAEDKFVELVEQAITDFHQSGFTPIKTVGDSNYFRIQGENQEQFIELILEETILTGEVKGLERK